MGNIRFRSDMPRRALEVIRYRPVILKTKILFHHPGHHRSDTAKLGMAKGIAQTLIGEKSTVTAAYPFRNHHGAVSEAFYFLINQCHKPLAIEGDFWKKNHNGNWGGFVACHPPGRRDPSGVSSHDL